MGERDPTKPVDYIALPEPRDPALEDDHEEWVYAEPDGKSDYERDLRARGFSAHLSFSGGYDDNVFRTRKDTESAYFYTIEPGIAARVTFGKHSLRLSYEGEYRDIPEFSDEDSFDHDLLADLRLDLTRRLKLNFQGGVKFGHDPRGIPGSRLDSGTDDLDRWREDRLFGEVVYGRRIAQAQLVGSIEPYQRRYLNNDQDDRDFDALRFRGRAYWNFGPKTSLFVEGDHAIIDYLDGDSELDSTENGAFAGLRWDFTAKTSGEFKLGYAEKDLDDSDQRDFDGFSWGGEVTWEPQTYSRVRAYTEREFREGSDPDVSQIVNNRFGVDWQHGFSERWVLDSGMSFNDTDFKNSDREDKLFEARAGIIYAARRWLELGAEYRFATRESDLSSAEYDDNVFELRVNLLREWRR